MSSKEINTKLPYFVWESKVRGYELDMQGIVNNSNYFCYFDHTRVMHLLSKGVDWQVWHKKGVNIVLTHVDLSIKSSLIAHDEFYITSQLKKSGRLKLIFDQNIYRRIDDKLIAHSINTVVCVSIINTKSIFPKELEGLLFQ